MATPDQAELPPEPPGNRKRCTDKELRERIEVVRRKLLTGETRKTVRVLITEEWGLKPTQAYWYLKEAEAEIQETAQRTKDVWLAEHIAIRREIRRKAAGALDLRVELAAADSEAKLLGLEQPTKHEHSGPDGKAIPVKQDVTLLDRIDQYTEAFVRAANREITGDPTDNGSGKPVDS
jgi:hypothetical protein